MKTISRCTIPFVLIVACISCDFVFRGEFGRDDELTRVPDLDVDSLHHLLEYRPVAKGIWAFSERFRKRWKFADEFTVRGEFLVDARLKSEYWDSARIIRPTYFCEEGLELLNKKRLEEIFGTVNVDSARSLYRTTSIMLVQNNIYEINSWRDDDPNLVTTFDSLTYLYGYTELDTVPSDVDASKIQYSADSLFWLVPLP